MLLYVHLQLYTDTTTHNTRPRESPRVGTREGGPPERARGAESTTPPSNLLLESKARTVRIHSRSVNVPPHLLLIYTEYRIPNTEYLGSRTAGGAQRRPPLRRRAGDPWTLPPRRIGPDSTRPNCTCTGATAAQKPVRNAVKGSRPRPDRRVRGPLTTWTRTTIGGRR